MAHDTEEIAAPDLLDVGFAVAAGKELTGEVEELGAVGESGDATVAVEVSAEAHMVDAHHLDGMLEVGKDVEDGGLTVAAQEAIVDGGLRHTAFGCEGPHLIVGEVAGMVAERPAAAVAAHDGHTADVEGIVEALFSGMAHVDEDAQAVHLVDDLLAEGTDTAMGGVATGGGVADVVVAIVAEGHVDDATVVEVLQVLQLSVEGDAVFDAEHDGFEPPVLVDPEVVGSPGKGDMGTVLRHYLFYLVEDTVGKGSGMVGGLRQVGYHDGSILTPFGHLLQVDENLGVALVEVDAFGEEHGGVAVGVEGEYTVVDTVGGTVAGGFADEPLEEGQSVGKAFGMPLDAEDGFVFIALHGFDDAVGGCGHGAEERTGVADSLMVEGVDTHFRGLVGHGNE